MEFEPPTAECRKIGCPLPDILREISLLHDVESMALANTKLATTEEEANTYYRKADDAKNRLRGWRNTRDDFLDKIGMCESCTLIIQ